MPEDHKCSFDHLDSGKQKLEKDLVKVAHDKIGSIWFWFRFLLLNNWSELNTFRIMIQEEIFELDKKIKQINGILDRRREKASEWNGNYRKILQVSYCLFRKNMTKMPICKKNVL